jgi:hypothetical protein
MDLTSDRRTYGRRGGFLSELPADTDFLHGTGGHTCKTGCSVVKTE